MPRTKPAKPTVREPLYDEANYPRRITVPISEELHRRIRITAAVRGSNIADEARRALENAAWEKAPT
jgi:hypothetical protein